MDGFSRKRRDLLAATNRPDVLDPALLRPGRFDRRIVVNRPDVKGREGILVVHTRKIPMADDVQIGVLARGSAGFSGADLANLVNEAALNAARYNQKVVRMHDFEFAKDKVLMGAERRSMIISDAEKRVTAIQERPRPAGRPAAPRIDSQVKIIPRGMALGPRSADGRRKPPLARRPERSDRDSSGPHSREVRWTAHDRRRPDLLERATELRAGGVHLGHERREGPDVEEEEQIFLGTRDRPAQDYREDTRSDDQEVRRFVTTIRACAGTPLRNKGRREDSGRAGWRARSRRR